MASVRFSHAIAISSATRVGHDRAAVYEVGDELVVALADGSGTSRPAALAAEAAVAAFARDVVDWDGLDGDLVRIGGQCAAVRLRISADRIFGESIGDSEAWLFADDRRIELTEHQIKKPLLGDGGIPVSFEAGPLAGATLVVASDGLWKYVSLAAIAAASRGEDLATTATSLIELARLPAGGLSDDVAVVIVR